MMTFVFRVAACAALLMSFPSRTFAQSSVAATVRASGPLADSLRAFAYRTVELLRNLDVRGSIALYGDTAHFVHVENGNVIQWSQLSTMMREFFRTAKSNPLSMIGEPGVTLIDRNNAVIYAVHHFDASEGRPAHDGVWTGVLHRTANGWRIVHSHSSDRR
jgi:ketosteroid isomerase-like protein